MTWTETSDLDACRADRPRRRVATTAGLLIDTLHFSRSNCDVAELAQAATLVVSTTRRSATHPPSRPTTLDELIHAARNERLFLGAGGLDVRGILGALPPTFPTRWKFPRRRWLKQVGLAEYARPAL